MIEIGLIASVGSLIYSIHSQSGLIKHLNLSSDNLSQMMGTLREIFPDNRGDKNEIVNIDSMELEDAIRNLEEILKELDGFLKKISHEQGDLVPNPGILGGVVDGLGALKRRARRIILTNTYIMKYERLMNKLNTQINSINLQLHKQTRNLVSQEIEKEIENSKEIFSKTIHSLEEEIRKREDSEALINALRKEVKEIRKDQERSDSIGDISNENATDRLKSSLINFYCTKGKIARLFNDMDLELSKYYINLGVIQKTRLQDEQEMKQVGSLRDARLKTFEKLYNITEGIKLRDLFKPKDQSAEQISKLLILGRAGIGKSTLSQYLVYQWATRSRDHWNKEKLLYHSDAEKRFELVIWIPLRELADYAATKPIESSSIGGFLSQQEGLADYIDLNIDFVNFLLKQLEKNSLYILDGYDEIVGLDGKHPVWKLISQLKNKSQWIITSRPYGLSEISADREVEIMGFNRENIHEYIQTYFEEDNDKKQMGEQLFSYLVQNPAVLGIAHIPIQLELICFIWDKEYDNYRGQSLEITNLTMTILYDKLSQRLKHQYLIDESRGKKRYPSKDERRVHHPFPEPLNEVVSAISAIALEGLINSKSLLISGERINNILKLEPYRKFDFPDLVEIGFIKPVGCKREPSDSTYCFLHLTFQEYYAAFYIVDTFLGKTKWFLTNYYGSVEDFIKKHKYDVQYEMVWCFVSGLLAEYGQQDQISEFFRLFNDQPHDALCLHRTILLIRLLEECIDQTGQVKVPEYKKAILEIGNHIVRIVMSIDGSLNKIRRDLAQSIGFSPRLVEDGLLHPLLELIKKEKFASYINNLVKIINFFELLGENCVSLPDEVKKWLIEVFQKENNKIKIVASGALAKQLPLPEQTIDALIKEINAEEEKGKEEEKKEEKGQKSSELSQKEKVKQTAIWTLGEYLSFNIPHREVITQFQREKITQVFLAILFQSPRVNIKIKCSAIKALGKDFSPEKWESINQHILKLMAASQNGNVVDIAAKVLAERFAQKVEYFETLIAKSLLFQKDNKNQKNNEKLKLNIARILCYYSGPLPKPEDIRNLLFNLLKSSYPFNKSIAAQALCNYPFLLQDQNIVDLLIRRVRSDSNPYVKNNAALALGYQILPTDATIGALLAILQDNIEVDWIAYVVDALNRLITINPEKIKCLTEIKSVFMEILDKNINAYVKTAVIKALDNKHLFEKRYVVERLKTIIFNECADYARSAALDVLKNQSISLSNKSSNESKEVISILMKSFSDDIQPYVRSTAADALAIFVENEDVIYFLIERLATEENFHVNNVIIRVLHGDPDKIKKTVSILFDKLISEKDVEKKKDIAMQIIRYCASGILPLCIEKEYFVLGENKISDEESVKALHDAINDFWSESINILATINSSIKDQLANNGAIPGQGYDINSARTKHGKILEETTHPNESSQSQININKERAPYSSSRFFCSNESKPQALYTDQVDNHWYSDDEIIVLYSYYIGGHPEVAYLDPMLGTDWGDRHNTLRDNLSAYHLERLRSQERCDSIKNKVIIPINLGQGHWVLVYAIYPEKGNELPRIYYFDPKGNTPPQNLREVLLSAGVFCGCEIINIGQRVQDDDYNCGPWIVEASRGIANNGAIPEQDYDINSARIEHANISKETIPPHESSESKININKERPQYPSSRFFCSNESKPQALFTDNEKDEQTKYAEVRKERRGCVIA